MKSVLLFTICLFTFATIHAQGGKAEAGRIQFAKGKTSTTLVGTLKHGEQQEYVFAAKAGQTVMIKNSTPAFDFRVFSEESFPDGDFDSSPTYTFQIPADGDYDFFVRRKVGGPKRATFRLTLSIK
jgi:hypothetical protein